MMTWFEWVGIGGLIFLAYGFLILAIAQITKDNEPDHFIRPTRPSDSQTRPSDFR